MGNRLLEKYQDVIKSIKDSTGIKIVSVEKVTKHYLDSFDQEQIHEINNFLP
jgi:ferritin